MGMIPTLILSSSVRCQFSAGCFHAGSLTRKRCQIIFDSFDGPQGLHDAFRRFCGQSFWQFLTITLTILLQFFRWFFGWLFGHFLMIFLMIFLKIIILLHCVAYIYAVWPVYEVKCLCSSGRECQDRCWDVCFSIFMNEIEDI